MSIQYIINNNDSTLTGQTINGDLMVTNSLSATTYYGDGSGLSNVGVSQPYKVYTALLNQTLGGGAPTARILENTLGVISWSYLDVGIYYGTLTSAFTVSSSAFTYDKTVVFLQKRTTLSAALGSAKQEVIAYRVSDNEIIVATMDDVDPIDGVLYEHAIEIRLYN
jgi:hypothetical protein